MPNLSLAVEIAKAVSAAANEPGPFDIDATADDLVAAHPESGASREQVVEVLIEEGTEAGVIPPKPSEF